MGTIEQNWDCPECFRFFFLHVPTFRHQRNYTNLYTQVQKQMQTQTQGYRITGPEEVCEKKNVFKEDVKEPVVQYCVVIPVVRTTLHK